ncbi:MAG: NAD-dependent epimerase/dehydratase family protein [Planctomycetia bacterium]|nr:NAD-dependent epimerase/dehydratase family protein [Planctomycetia bacterium]
MNYFVTGGAGFIGSNLVDRLLAAGHSVTAIDNFSTGQRQFLADAQKNPRFALIEGDLLDLPALTRAVAGHEFVFHLAANADVRFGTNHPSKDLQQNTIATFNVLEAMRANGVKRIGFSSTGSVYGEPEVFPTPETAPFPIQTSLYAASKVAGEGLISAYAAGFGFQAFIFRFVSILGERYTHGHVFDFYAKLLANPHAIEVLGDGKQRKSYLYVQDCIDAIFTVVAKATEPVNVVNLGADEYCQVDDSLGWICERLGLNPKRNYTGGKRGWIGDSPFIFLDTAKLKSFGWKQKLSIRDSVIRTLDYLRANEWVLESRKAA